MARSRNSQLWYRDIEEMGVELTLRERSEGSNLYLMGTVQGQRIRRSMKTAEPKMAERRARAVMREIAQNLLNNPRTQTPIPPPVPTVDRVFSVYRAEQLPHKKKRYRTDLERAMREFTSAVGARLRTAGIGQQHIDRFVRRRDADGLKSSTLRHELDLICVIFNWATRYKQGPHFLLEENPFDRLRLPPVNEDEMATPIASHDRFENTLRAVRHVEPSGLLFTALYTLRYTGRRWKGVSHLRWGDIVRETGAVAALLAERGDDPLMANCWPHGAIRWRAEFNKKRRGSVVPISPVLATILERWQKEGEKVRDEAWVFPAADDSDKPCPYGTAYNWLMTAEAHAREEGHVVPNQEGGCFHPYRRLWRSERAGLFHDKVIATVAGWQYEDRFTPPMNRNYFRVLAEKMYEAVSASPGCDVEFLAQC